MHIANRSRLTFRHEALWMRLTARSILAGWLLPMLFALFAVWQTATPAQAQDEARQTVVVLDFATAPGLDPLLGRKAADALAVELQRSNEYTVISRQRVDETVGQQAGLQPPFNDTAQRRLAEALGARSVFSGTVSRVEITPGTLARVDLQVRQLDAATADYINGTFAREATEQRLSAVANEILVDEAINKAAFSAVRSMRQTNLPEGTVLNTTRDDLEISIGARNGVVAGQRYSILRDIRNNARNVTERLKIGEVTILRVQNDQAVAILSAGGAAGVRTGDRVRQIFVASAYPITAANGGTSVSPVTAIPQRDRGDGGGRKKTAKGLLGLLSLVALVSLTGLGGGSGGASRPEVANIRYANITQSQPIPTFTINQEFSGISIFQGLQSEASVGYLVYRGTAPGFTPEASNLQAFVDGRVLGSGSRITFSDSLDARTRNFSITSSASNNGVPTLNVTENVLAVRPDFFNQTDTGITFQFTQRPLTIGTTYYYRVVRIGAERRRSTADDGTGAANVDIVLLPVRGDVSQSTGGFTPLVLPVIVRDQDQYNTDNFSVRVNSQTEFDLLGASDNIDVPLGANAATGVDEFRVEVSTSSSFSADSTFVSPNLPPPTANISGDLVFDLGNIRIPDTADNPFEPGQTTLYVRVSSRSDESEDRRFRPSRALILDPSQITGVDSATNSRFLKPAKSGISIGSNRGGTGVSSAGRGKVSVLRPR